MILSPEEAFAAMLNLLETGAHLNASGSWDGFAHLGVLVAATAGREFCRGCHLRTSNVDLW